MKSVMFLGLVLESQGPLNLEIPSVAVSFFFFFSPFLAILNSGSLKGNKKKKCSLPIRCIDLIMVLIIHHRVMNNPTLLSHRE